MKIKSLVSFALFSSFSVASYAAVLPFPIPGTPAVTPGDALDGSWTQSDGQAASSKLGFYATLGGLNGVGVGGLYDDYAAIMALDDNFSVSTTTATVGVSGGTISDWYFALTAPTLDYPALNDFSIGLKDTFSNNLISILLTNVNATQYSVTVNGSGIGFIDIGGTYQLTAAFGVGSGLDVSVTGLGTISYQDLGFVTTGKTFGSLEVGASQGAGADFGNGYITLVPEPSSAMLAALVPAFFILRRRR